MLVKSGMVEKASGTTALSLEMQAHESARIRDLYLYEATNAAEDVKITVDQKSVLQFKGAIGTYILSEDVSDGYLSVKSILRDLGLLPTIPLAAGQILGATPPGANNYMEVVYDLYTADDVKKSEPNGTEAAVYRMLQVISNSGTRATAGDLALDQSDLDSEFIDFPGGKVVPAKHQVELLALFGVAVSEGTGAANGEYTTYLKMLSELEDILDKDRTGLTFLGNVAHVGASVSYDTIAGRLSCGVQHNPPQVIVFDRPIIFPAGTEVNVIATIARTGAGADFAAGDIKLGMVMDVRRTG